MVFGVRVGRRHLRARQSVYATIRFPRLRPNAKDIWSIGNPDDVNGGVNHFGSPFNFPEEFITVYRLHPLVPDLLDFRDWNATRT